MQFKTLIVGLLTCWFVMSRYTWTSLVSIVLLSGLESNRK